MRTLRESPEMTLRRAIYECQSLGVGKMRWILTSAFESDHNVMCDHCGLHYSLAQEHRCPAQPKKLSRLRKKNKGT